MPYYDEAKLREDAVKIFSEGVKAAHPDFIVPEFFKTHPELLDEFRKIQSNGNSIFCFSLGKAAYSMALALQKIISPDFGYILTKDNHIPRTEFTKGKWGVWDLREGSHPFPDERTELHSRELILNLSSLKEGDLFLTLLSGGGSSLLELSEDGVSLEDIINLNQKLLSDGSDIHTINKERKKLSKLKGGKLLNFLNPGVRSVTLALSDVIGDDPSTIASAPTYPGSEYHIIGNLSLSLNKAKLVSEELGYSTQILSTNWSEDAKKTGSYFVELAYQKRLQNFPCPSAFIMGGEMVSTVKNKKGLGGRNQEACLSFVFKSFSFQLANICFLSAGSDGTDGPTDAAGGVVTESTYSKIQSSGTNIEFELENSNSNYALQKGESLLITGPTGTNVNDILILLLGEVN